MDRFSSVAGFVEILGSWSTGGGPLYRKLADGLARAVDEGGIQPGDRLPSERQLATALAISRSTVVGAYDELRSRGVLESQTGSGTRVSDRVQRVPTDGRVRNGAGTAIFQRLIDGPGSFASLACAAGSGISDVAEALHEVANHDMPDLLADPGYHPRGLPALRAAIAEHYGRLGLPTSPDEILVTTGAHQALMLASELFLSRSSPTIVEAPSLPACLDVFRSRDAQLVPVPLDAEGIDIQRLTTAMTQRTPDLLYVMPSYHNPTGKLMSAARRRQVAELAARHGVPVLEDNAYSGLTQSEDNIEPPPLAAFAPGDAEVLSVGSMGKAVWGGLRIGWLRGPASIVERCARRKALADLGGPLVDQALTARLIPRLAELTAKQSITLRQHRELLENALRAQLPEWTWQRPEGGASLWVALPGVDSGVFAQLALRHGVEIIPGSAMDPAGTHDDHIRIPFAYAPEVLTTIVDRLARAWTEFQRYGPFDNRPISPVI